MKTSERLLARLREMEDIPPQFFPEGAYLVRVNASPSARAEGAWSWMVWTDGPKLTAGDLGSQWPMAELLRAAKLSVQILSGDAHIDPVWVGE